jgi:hypothetical protein
MSACSRSAFFPLNWRLAKRTPVGEEPGFSAKRFDCGGGVEDRPANVASHE